MNKNSSLTQVQSVEWTALGGGVNGIINAVAVSGNYIYVGGSFSSAGGVPANNIARWNTSTSSWSALIYNGNNGVDGTVYAICVDASGIAGYDYVIYVGGIFNHAGGISTPNIAGWYNFEGDESWRALGAGVNSTVFSFALDITSQYDYLYVGGNFTSANGRAVNHITAFDSGNDGWSNDLYDYFSPGTDGDVYSIVVSGSNVYVGGEFTNAGATALNCIGSYNTSTLEWTSLNSGMSGTNKKVYSIALSGSDIFVGGVFDHAGDVSANNIAEWDGSNWSALGNGVVSTVNTIKVAQSRYVYTGGSFTQAGGASGNNITKWNGANWSALGDGANNTVRSITISGDFVYAGGDFTQAGGSSANHIAKFLDTDFYMASVTTSSITNVGTSTASGGGNVTSDHGYGVTARGVCWGTSQNPTTSDSHTTDGSGTGSFTSSLSGLTDGTNYHVRAYATNYYGTSYGDDLVFTTISSSPGSALNFDGLNDYVNVNDNTALDLTTNYTIEVWIKPSTFKSRAGIVSKYQSSGANGYVLRLTNTSPYSGLTFDGASTSNGILTADTWYHIAAVNDNGTRHLYLNGVEQTLSGTPITVQANTDVLCIGVDFKVNIESDNRCFPGAIDEVRIWNTVRTQQQIHENLHRTFDNAESGLVGYWQFNDGSGSSSLVDVAGGHNGTLTNMDNANAWVSSTIPVGGGTSYSSNSFTTGTASLGNVQLTTSDAFDNAVDLVNTEINRAPNTTSGTSGNVINKYFVIKAYGTPGSFSTNLTFTLPEGYISASDQSTPSNLKLYRRESNAEGDWSLAASASSATSTTVTFNGITSFSQFIIASESSPLPVELTSFGAECKMQNVELSWETATEVNNYGFSVERRVMNEEWKEISFVKGSGNSNSPKSYSYTDATAPSGKVQYRLKQIDFDGKYEYSEVVEVTIDAPAKFELEQNYPNPFNPTTAISYQLSAVSHVTLKVYDVLGREVATLVNEKQNAGVYKIAFDGSKYSSGVYFYRIRANQFIATRKFVLMK